tara:strand:+ start:45 stop:641 length:597 start_codon:yes stop_codon:yes gene_type:complete
MNTTKAIAYIRVSTGKQENTAHSLVAQREKIQAYASLYDLDIVDYVIETGSAKNLNREGLDIALNKIKSGEVSAIIVTKLDRLTRSVADLGLLINEYFTDHELLSVSEHIDTRSAGGRLILNILTSVSQWEREAIGERTSAVEAIHEGERIVLWWFSSIWPNAHKRASSHQPTRAGDHQESQGVKVRRQQSKKDRHDV